MSFLLFLFSRRWDEIWEPAKIRDYEVDDDDDDIQLGSTGKKEIFNILLL